MATMGTVTWLFYWVSQPVRGGPRRAIPSYKGTYSPCSSCGCCQSGGNSPCHPAHEANCTPFFCVAEGWRASPVARRAGHARAWPTGKPSAASATSEAAMATIGAVTWLFQGQPTRGLVGTTTVVVGRQYISFQHVRTAFDLQCTMGRPRSGRSRSATRRDHRWPLIDHFEPIQAVQCAQAGIRPSGPVAAARAESMHQKCACFFPTNVPDRRRTASTSEAGSCSFSGWVR
jgi:hypothetical protein